MTSYKNGGIIHCKEGGGRMGIVILILSAIIAALICKIINRNTIGTTGAYAKRYFIVFVVVMFLLTSFADTLGIIQL